MPTLQFEKAEFTAAYGLAAQLPPANLPEFVFAGRSNVGKSSLINKLCNRKKLARVSASPGKTATINFYTAGDACLVDLPGYGYAKTSQSERRRWDSLINGYFSQNRKITILLQLLDCRHEPSKDDLQMLAYLKSFQIPFIAVLTKLDKKNKSEWDTIADLFQPLILDFGGKDIIKTSSESNVGIEELRQYMQFSL